MMLQTYSYLRLSITEAVEVSFLSEEKYNIVDCCQSPKARAEELSEVSVPN